MLLATAVLLREKSVLACYFLLIVRKKMQTYVSMSAFFMTSLRQKISNPKLPRTTKILFLSAEQGKKSHNPDGLWDFLTQLCAKNMVFRRLTPKKQRRNQRFLPNCDVLSAFSENILRNIICERNTLHLKSFPCKIGKLVFIRKIKFELIGI